eukprot:gb/GFBE01018389.1/.p1 GENE.gb/GFBE01018389.1/~~gb/GFBE01018389.1/.p1  ORF type:complete len:457 (+),score=95.21 gb/GFBE01018389.1/:1-1371(+)
MSLQGHGTAAMQEDGEVKPLQMPRHEENERRPSKLRAAAQATAKRAASVVAAVREVNPLTTIVMSAGSLLAVCAGMVNAIAFLVAGNFVSHVTGTVSKISLFGQASKSEEATHVFLIVLFFIIGSVACGCLIKRSTVKIGNAGYGAALTLNALLIVLALVCWKHSVKAFVYLLCAACGLQNGMITAYSGAVIRTTHVTGISTDIGLIVGRHIMAFLRRRLCAGTITLTIADEDAGDVRKLVLLLLLMASFMLGILLGAILTEAVGEMALLVPASISLMTGLGYMCYRRFGPAAEKVHSPDPARVAEAKLELGAWSYPSPPKPTLPNPAMSSPSEPSDHRSPDMTPTMADHALGGEVEPVSPKYPSSEPWELPVSTTAAAGSAAVLRSGSKSAAARKQEALDAERKRLIASVDGLRSDLSVLWSFDDPKRAGDDVAEALQAHQRLKEVIVRALERHV